MGINFSLFYDTAYGPNHVIATESLKTMIRAKGLSILEERNVDNTLLWKIGYTSWLGESSNWYRVRLIRPGYLDQICQVGLKYIVDPQKPWD